MTKVEMPAACYSLRGTNNLSFGKFSLMVPTVHT